MSFYEDDRSLLLLESFLYNFFESTIGCGQLVKLSRIAKEVITSPGNVIFLYCNLGCVITYIDTRPRG
jgi:hypothetical protein